MEVHSSGSDRSAEIDRCLSLISPSQPDESKFVGMLLLPRLLQQDQAETVRRVFDGMNFKFIERLLRTTSNADSSSGSDSNQVPEPVLREIAINVLACFAKYDDMAKSTVMADRVPVVAANLVPNDSSDATKEALHILLCVCVTKQGLSKMLDPDSLKHIYELLNATKNDRERELASQVISSTYTRACHLLYESNIPSLSSALKYSLQTTFTGLSAILKKNQGKLKFEALAILAHLLPDLPSQIVKKFKEENEKKLSGWLHDLRAGLKDILSSKLGDEQRDQAMVVAACLLRYFGPDWMFSSLKHHKEDKFPTLLVHLVAVETRVMLDEIHDRRMNLHNRQAVKVDEAKEKRQESMVPVYFEILEAAIRYLSLNFNEDKASGMDAEVLLKIRKTLSDTMNVVMELLKFIQDTTDNDDQLEKDMIAQASMRIIALYLAEEGYEL
ncbi:hypothetical protein VTP01DRAFT_10702 [Rhizomucor pusillus]|uniref:uncharacterized protein n=1 Tax=Rhizomucor pusillus TaxID=4840 RepID=UPI003742F801